MREFDNKLKFTALGIISLVIWTFFCVIYGLIIAIAFDVLGLLLFIWYISLLIPICELFYKAYIENKLQAEYQLSTLSLGISIVGLGLPFLFYGFASYVARKLFCPNKKLNQTAKITWIIAVILSFGLIYFNAAMYEYIAKRSFRDVIEFENPKISQSSKIILIIFSILSLGFIWLSIYMNIAMWEWVSKGIAKRHFQNTKQLSTATIIWLVVLTLFTFGIIWFNLILFYGLVELCVVLYYNEIKERIT